MNCAQPGCGQSKEAHDIRGGSCPWLLAEYLEPVEFDRHRALLKRWIKVAALGIYEYNDEGLDNALRAIYDLLHA